MLKCAPLPVLSANGFGMNVASRPSSAAIVLRHHPEKDVAIAHRQRVGVFEIEFELRIRVLVVETVKVPAEGVDRRGHLVEPGETIDETLHVVATLDEIVVGVGHAQPALFVQLHDVDLALDAEIEAEAHAGGLGEHLLQGDARVDLVRLAVKGVVRRHPGHLRPPRQDRDGFEIGHGADFVVVGALAEAVERVAGVELGAVGEM